jgi:hypothetical protein
MKLSSVLDRDSDLKLTTGNATSIPPPIAREHVNASRAESR